MKKKSKRKPQSCQMIQKNLVDESGRKSPINLIDL